MTNGTKKQTAKQLVADHLEQLRTLDCAGLTAFGKEHGYDSRAGFASYKKALLAAGIDYDAIRETHREEQREQRLSACTHQIILFSDAKSRTERFGIADAAGNPVWFGRFFDDDRDFNGEQSSGEMAAAKKAVWLASQVAKAIGARTIRLRLKVDAEWLTWANATDEKVGGKARALRQAAERLNVVLEVEHVAGATNPADKLTVCSGFKKWQDNDLRALAEPIAASESEAGDA